MGSTRIIVSPILRLDDLISNKFSIYPNVQYSENLITCIANKYSYKLIYDFPGIESFAKNSYSKSLVFKKES